TGGQKPPQNSARWSLPAAKADTKVQGISFDRLTIIAAVFLNFRRLNFPPNLFGGFQTAANDFGQLVPFCDGLKPPLSSQKPPLKVFFLKKFLDSFAADLAATNVTKTAGNVCVG
ncbi:hypothetical protein A2U01_0059450, partial [Trifolium medium]|nr:hypothetical protein [Trifolium medium]